MAGYSQGFAGVSGSGTVTNSIGGNINLTVGNNNATSLFSGNISDGNGSTRLTKTGSGTVTLTGVTTYTGSTAVNQGTLAISGSSSSPTVSVASGAFLGGTGTAGAVNVAVGGGIAAGSFGPGTLTLASLNFAGSGAINIANFTSYASVPAVNVTGSNGITFGGAANSITLALSGVLPYGSGTLRLLEYSGQLQGSGSYALSLGTAGMSAGPRTVLSLTATDAGYIDMNYLSDYPVWTGLGDKTWSLAAQSPTNWRLGVTGGTTNWQATDAALFDDTANGTGTLYGQHLGGQCFAAAGHLQQQRQELPRARPLRHHRRRQPSP